MSHMANDAFGRLMESFAREIIGPLLLADRPSAPLCERVNIALVQRNLGTPSRAVIREDNESYSVVRDAGRGIAGPTYASA